MDLLRRRIDSYAMWLRQRLLPALRDDRGEASPPVAAILIVGGAILAIAVLAALYAVTGGFMDQAPTELPAPGFGE